MSTLTQRLGKLVNLIQLKEKASKAKFKLLSSITSSKSQFHQLKRSQFTFETIGQLFRHLISINTRQLVLMLIFSLVSLVLRLFCANINTFIIQKFEEQHLVTNLVYCILLLVIYKVVKAVIDQWSSYLQMNYGFKGYSALYYHFLYGKTEMTGEVLNIIEDDMEKVANLPYSLVNFPFLTILILVLTVMLAYTLQFNIVFVVAVSFLLYAVNCIGGVIVFYLNQKLMRQKDFRLSLNLTQNQNPQSIKQARKKEVSMIRTFLLIKVMVKWFMQVCFVLLYGLVFLWSSQVDNKVDQLYYRLMLLGMLKISFNSLFMESYYIALVLNSLKRIIQCQNREQIEKSTIGCYEDFLKKNKKTPPQIQTQRQSTESSVYSQNSMNDSILKSSSRLSVEQSQSGIQIKEIKIKPLENNQIQKPHKKYSERGQIKILELLSYIKSNIRSVLSISLLILGIITLYVKFENLRISASIIHNRMEVFQYTVFVLPVVLYTLFYLSIILVFSQVSQNLFRNLSSQQIEGEDLNRISGDIQIVDKYVPPAFFQFFITIFGLLASLILTVSLIKDPIFALFTAVLLLIIIAVAIYFNRYFMKSRREIKRLQCKTKSSIIQTYAEHISQHKEEEVPFSKVQKSWKKINVLKNIGIAIENSYILLLNLLVLLIQVICFIICFVSSLDSGTTKLILVFILQLDLSLTGLLLNTINLEMGLVNFERCLNFVKRKMNAQNIIENKKNQLRESVESTESIE